ncbi:MAG: hypothetical protein IJC20_03195, partial [Clostridia bacterium]|nr:hypothetical protein [Clostridia bacterium]
YEITPREITEEDLIEFGKNFGVTGKIRYFGNNPTISIDFPISDKITRDIHVQLCNGNELSYLHTGIEVGALTTSDEALIKEAKAIFEKITILEGEYECLGVTSEQIVTGKNDEKYVESKRISFRKLLDGTRVIGNEICDMYFHQGGLYDIEIHLYEYEKIGEIKMVSLEDAKDKIKKPDAFTVSELEGKNALTSTADKLTVERIKLIYVNQYSSGSTIIQPVYNFIGVASHGDEEMEFQSKVIAIPKKYTYDD